MSKPFTLFFTLFFSFSSLCVCLGGESAPNFQPKEKNPFSAKASVIRYWNAHVSNHLPKPSFLLSKASPLNAVDLAVFSRLASQRALSSQIVIFCRSANLICNLGSAQTSHRPSPHPREANFVGYTNKQFSNYGPSSVHGVDSFKNYSSGVNMPTNSFTRYSPGSTGHGEDFTNYANNANVGNDSFSNYGQGATGGSGVFANYEPNANVPNLRFTSYSLNGNHHELSFGSYSDDTNSGSESFTSYAKNGNGVPSQFTNYADSSNILGSSFSSYSELGNGANDSFKGYSSNANNPHNNFKNYASGVNSGVESFVNYRDSANVGDDTFLSYSRTSNSAKASFLNYGKSFNDGSDTFKEYSTGAVNRDIEFKSYGVNNSFKGYEDHKGVTFSEYRKRSLDMKGKMSQELGGKIVNKWVEEGKFFRESMLKPGNQMKMPDIRDKMPKRSFLPRVISSKLPFSTLEVQEMKQIFRAGENSTLESVMKNALSECERPPSPGETKWCVASIEDMLDFALSVLGDNVTVRTIENVNGSGQTVVIGSVRGINGGKVTKSVSCHQSLFPYLLYYCHSVPKVRVYEADILDLGTRAKVNHGVAICHLDTTAWSAGHGAFVALGSGPGLIEVCHWIFENDMTWTTAD